MTRPASAVVAVVLLLGFAPETCADFVQGLPKGRRALDAILVANSEGGTVDVIDARAPRLLRTLNVIPDHPVGTGIGSNVAQDLDVAPDGRTLYVSRGYLSDVAAFDLETGDMLWRLPISGGRADHMAIIPDGTRLFVSATFADVVEVIDPRTPAVIGSFSTGDFPHGVHLGPDAKTVFVGAIGLYPDPNDVGKPHELTVASVRTLRVRRRLVFPEGLRPFQISPDGRKVYMQFSRVHAIREVSARTGEVLRELPVPIDPSVRDLDPLDYPLAVALHGLETSPRKKRLLCVAGTLSDWVGIVDRRRWTLVRTVPVDDEPGWVTSSPDGRYCVSSNRGPNANTVSFVSYKDPREVQRIATSGLHPQHVLGARLARAAFDP